MKKIMLIVAVISAMLSTTVSAQVNPELKSLQITYLDEFIDSLAVQPDFAELKIKNQQSNDSPLYSGYVLIQVEDIDTNYWLRTFDLLCYEVNITWEKNEVQLFSISRDNSYVKYYPSEKRFKVMENGVEKEIISHKYFLILDDIKHGNFTTKLMW